MNKESIITEGRINALVQKFVQHFPECTFIVVAYGGHTTNTLRSLSNPKVIELIRMQSMIPLPLRFLSLFVASHCGVFLCRKKEKIAEMFPEVGAMTMAEIFAIKGLSKGMVESEIRKGSFSADLYENKLFPGIVASIAVDFDTPNENEEYWTRLYEADSSDGRFLNELNPKSIKAELDNG